MLVIRNLPKWPSSPLLTRLHTCVVACPSLWILLLLLSHFSHVRLCATPETAAHQAPLSLGFSRQEHWSGLSFPSPMHEGEKWKWSRSVVSDPQRPHGLQPCRLLHPWDFPGKSTGVGCHCLLRKDNTPFTILFDSKKLHCWFCCWNRYYFFPTSSYLVLKNVCSSSARKL